MVDFTVIYDPEESDISALLGLGLSFTKYWIYDSPEDEEGHLCEIKPNTNYLVLDYNPFKYISEKYYLGFRNAKYNKIAEIPRVGIANNINFTFCYSNSYSVKQKLSELSDETAWLTPKVPNPPKCIIINDQNEGANVLNYLKSLSEDQYYGFDYETNGFPSDTGFLVTGLSISIETKTWFFDYRRMGISDIKTEKDSIFLTALVDFLSSKDDHCIVYNCNFEMMVTYRTCDHKWFRFYDLAAINVIKNRGIWNNLKWTARLVLNVNSWDDEFEKFTEYIDDCSKDNFKEDLLEYFTEEEADEIIGYYGDGTAGNHNALYALPQGPLAKYCGFDSYYTLMTWIEDTKGISKDCIDVYCSGKIFETRLNQMGQFKDKNMWEYQVSIGKKYMLQGATCLLHYYYFLAKKENDQYNSNVKIEDYNELTQYFLRLGYDNNQSMYNFAKSLMGRYYNEECEDYLDTNLIYQDLGEELGGTFIDYIWEACDSLVNYQRKRKLFEWLGDLLEPYISKVTDVDGHEVMIARITYDKYLEDIKNFPWVGIPAHELPDVIDWNGESWTIQECLNYVSTYANVNTPNNKAYINGIYKELNQQRIFYHFRSREWDWIFNKAPEEIDQWTKYYKGYYTGDLYEDYKQFIEHVGDIVELEGEITSLDDQFDPDRVSKSGYNVTGDDYSVVSYINWLAEDNTLALGYNLKYGFELTWLNDIYPGLLDEIQDNVFRGKVIYDQDYLKFFLQLNVARRLFDKYYKSTYTYLEGNFYKYDENYEKLDRNWLAEPNDLEWDDNLPSKSYNKFTANSVFSHRWASGWHTVPSKSHVKKCHTSPDDALLTYFDINALEIRVAAYTSGDPELIGDFESGQDPYIKCARIAYPTASESDIKEARSTFKVVLLGWLYGRGIASLAESLGITLEEGKRIQSTLSNRFKVLGEFIKQKSQYPIDHDGYIDTKLGNIIISEDREDKMRRHGINVFIQNFASVLVVYGFEHVLREGKRRNIRIEPTSVVHDSSCMYFPIENLWDINDITYYGLTEHIKERFKVNLKFDLMVGTNYYDVVECKCLESGKVVEIKGTNLAIGKIIEKLKKNNVKFKVEFSEPNPKWDEDTQTLHYEVLDIEKEWVRTEMKNPVYELSYSKSKCKLIKC